MGPKMTLLLGFVDLVDRIVSSILSISRGTLGVKEGLHVTVFGKNASLSLERASNCTNIPYFETVSKLS